MCQPIGLAGFDEIQSRPATRRNSPEKDKQDGNDLSQQHTMLPERCQDDFPTAGTGRQTILILIVVN
jgi:hypothetical protein